MSRMLVTGFAVFAGFGGLAYVAEAGLLFGTGPVIAILAGDLFQGEAEGNPDGSGTIRIRSRDRPDVTCLGQFTSSTELSGAGNMRCSDGAAATYQFQRLGTTRGHGSGSSARGALSFTYGLGALEAEPYLTLPSGKALRLEGKDLVLVDVGTAIIVSVPVTAPIVPLTDAAPDVLLSAATSVVTARLRQDRDLQTNSPKGIAELVESTILPLFDFHHMTQLAVARHWHLASPEQRHTLIVEFRTLLVRTYSTALASYRDQAIEYKALRVAPGATDVTVRSTVSQSGAEPSTIDYNMEKTVAGWKVYDIKISGMSLITTYRETFARTVRDGGIEGLIKSLSAKNRQADARLMPDGNVEQYLLLMYGVIPSVLRSGP